MTIEEKYKIIDAYSDKQHKYLYVDTSFNYEAKKWIVYSISEHIEISTYQTLLNIMTKSRNTTGHPTKEPSGILYVNLLYKILKDKQLI